MSSQARSNRLDRRKQETRARILEAAVELFGEVGFEATKVADVCERADVARQTFFNHFPSKSWLSYRAEAWLLLNAIFNNDITARPKNGSMNSVLSMPVCYYSIPVIMLPR